MIELAALHSDYLPQAANPAGKPVGQSDSGNPAAAIAQFSGYMEKAMSPTASPQEQLRHLSEMYVANAMIMPVFEQMRSDPLAANLVHGGRGEEVFQQQMDQMLSDRIASSSRFGLAEAVYKELSTRLPGAGLQTHG